MDRNSYKTKYSQALDIEYADKTVPKSIEAEQVVLGAILVDPNAISQAALTLTPQSFYLEKHAQLFECMTELFNLSMALEAVPLLEKMREHGYYAEEDKEYILSLITRHTGIESLEYYVNIIAEKSALREVIEICKKVTGMCFDSQSLPEVLDTAESLFYSIKNGRSLDALPQLHTVVREVMKNVQDMQNDTTGKYVSVKTGIDSLDKITGGFGKGDLVILAARPGVGKTALALNIAYNIASSSNYNPRKSVVVFSLEMSSEQLAKRIISSSLLIDSVHLRDGTLNDAQWDDLYDYWHNVLPDVPLYCDDTPNITALDMKSKLRKVKNLGLVVIDYLQLMNSAKNTDNRVQELSEITRSLKLMAKEFNVPILLLSQLSRNIEQRNKGDRAPRLSDLRDSGSIEQDADMVFFISKPEGAENNPALQNVKELYVEKNRHGQTGKIELIWDGNHTAFRSKATSFPPM